MNDEKTHENKKWWSYGHVWLVVGLPFTVVVASFFTLYLAVSRPNEILSVEAYSSAESSGTSKATGVHKIGEAPAMQGRNHAATGVIPQEK